MDEGRKRALLIAARILAGRRLAHLETLRPSPVSESAIADSIMLAERIMQRIDSRWPMEKSGSQDKKEPDEEVGDWLAVQVS